jgi:NADP-reducing hydrogenase subunit HndB
MAAIKSVEELRRLKEEVLAKRAAKATTGRTQITVYMGTCGIAAGARDTMKAILGVIEADNLSDVLVKQTGCIGLCEWEPLVDVEVGDEAKVSYGKVTAERAERIMREHVIGGEVVGEFVVPA